MTLHTEQLTITTPHRRSFDRWKVGLAAVFGCLILVSAFLGPRLYSTFSLLNSGEQVDVGGREIFIRCLGSGKPTVILEHGLGSNGHEWLDVQDLLKDTYQVCFTSRSGMGFSDNAPEQQRTAQDAVDDLSTVLDQAGVEGPYVLVGHSFGGFVIRLFADQHAQSVVGMVLVDSAHERQAEVLRQELSPEAWAEIADLFESGANSERMGFVASAEQVRQLPSLGALPLRVLEAGDQSTGNDGSLSRKTATEIDAVMARYWPDMQRELSQLSSSGRHELVADSGHFIQVEQPASVADAVREVAGS